MGIEFRNIDTQLFLSETEPDENLFNPVTGFRSTHNKPVGGLWTSSKYRADSGMPTSSFIEWSKGNLKYDEEQYVWEIKINKPVKLLVVNNSNDLIHFSTLVDKGTIDERYEFNLDYIFNKLCCDGIWLTNEGVRNLCNILTDKKYSLKSWDVESIIWSKWLFDSIQKLRTYNL